jgi:ferredoxin
MKILIIYFSGVGNTRYLARFIAMRLTDAGHSAVTVPVERFEPGSLHEYDLAGFGSAVYHTTPPGPIIGALEKCRVDGMPLFTFWTMGLYAADCAKKFHDRAVNRGFRPVANLEAVFPGTDLAMQVPEGSLLARLNLRVDKKLEEKVAFLVETLSGDLEEKRAGSRWYAPLDAIAQRMGIPVYEKYKKRLYADMEACTRCDLCMKSCPTQSIYLDDDNVYQFTPETCILCLRCYHRCPARAVKLENHNKRPGQYPGPHVARNYIPLSPGQ